MTALTLCVGLDHDYRAAIRACLDNIEAFPDSELPLWAMVGEVIEQWADLPLWLERPVSIPDDIEGEE